MQFNVGVQREISAGTVLTVDYVLNHGVGLPFFIPDFERRRDAATLNVAAARTQVNRVLGGLTVDDWIQRNPTRNISAFGLITDTIFQGLYPQMTRARLFQGGFTKYQGLQVAVRGRVRQKWGLRDVSYNVSYALGRAQNANSAGSRVEFITNPLNNRNWNDKATFGPHALDRTHMFSTALYMTAPGGFRLQSYWVFNTAPPRTITVPNLGGAISGAQGFFGTDLNGDGGTGTSPRGDVFPGINAGGMGRQIHSFDELNKIISAFNQNNAGKITPHGQALVTAGLFTEAQLRRLGAVVPTVPLVPTSNPWPFHNLFTTDLRFDRPIRLTKVREGFSVIPFVDFLNLFNHAPVGAYAGLLGRFGSLNYDYSAAPAGQKLSDLYAQTHRITPTRRIQVGVRVEF